ncbi:uncharacterized protein LOC135465722 [Liolophura sinensis]|uniref:uncharacterized protein LOC135465722 n=1 Tax=Liolophura sinensis TaxID=3198878 RepID=UPI003158A43F
MADDSTITPRTLIKDLLEAKVTQNAVSAQRRRSLRQSSSTQNTKPVLENPVPQPSTSRKNKRRSSFSDVTPRSAIQKFLETHETAKPETRKRRRIEETEVRESVGGYASLTSQRRRSARLQTPVIETPGKNLTPRTVIAGFLRQAVSETPIQSQRESDGLTLPPIPPEPLLIVEDSPLNVTAHQRPRRSPRTMTSYVSQHSVQFDFTLGSIVELEDEKEVIPESQPQASPEREQTQGGAWRSGSVRDTESSTPRSGPHITATSRSGSSGSSGTHRRKSLRSSRHRSADRTSVDSVSAGMVHHDDSASASDGQWEPTAVSDLNSHNRLNIASSMGSPGKPRHSGRPGSPDLSYPERSAPEEETGRRDHRRKSAFSEGAELSLSHDDNDVQGVQSAAGILQSKEGEDSVSQPDGGSEAPEVHTSAQASHRDRQSHSRCLTDDVDKDMKSVKERVNNSAGPEEVSSEENIDLHISDNSSDKDRDNVEGDDEIEDVENQVDDVERAIDEGKEQVADGDNDIEGGEEDVNDGGNETVSVAPEHVKQTENRETVSEDSGTDRHVIYGHSVNTSMQARPLAKDITAVISQEGVVQDVQHDLSVLRDSQSRLGDSPAGPGDSLSTEDMNSRLGDSVAMANLSVASGENSGEEATPSHRVQKYVQVKTPNTVRNTTVGKMLTPMSVSRLAGNMNSAPKPVTTGKQKITKPKPRPEKKTKMIGKLRMPASLTKGIFSHFLKSNISKDVLNEVEKIADKYWTNVTSDLGAFADHAGRVTVTEEDVELLMKRQGFATGRRSMYTLVEQYLPLEYKQEIVPMARAGNVLYPRH